LGLDRSYLGWGQGEELKNVCNQEWQLIEAVVSGAEPVLRGKKRCQSPEGNKTHQSSSSHTPKIFLLSSWQMRASKLDSAV
jgi:hypothetical protein